LCFCLFFVTMWVWGGCSSSLFCRGCFVSSLPFASCVSRSACCRGASGFGVRPSLRAVSGFVAVAGFARSVAAAAFAAAWSVRLPSVCRGVRLRRAGRLWWVSVPVSAASVPAAVLSGAPVVAVGSPPAVRASFASSLPAAPAPSPAPAPSRRLSVAAVLAGAWPAPVAPALPAAVVSALGGAFAVGFSGSRSVVPPAFAAAAAAVPPSVPVLVGCASGVDRAARAAFPAAVVFSAARSCGPGAFAARSVSFVSALSRRVSPVLLSFPSGPCPSGLVPSAVSSRCFCGLGSGSWASLAFAAGLGVACFVWLPACALPAPSWLFPLGGGWFSVCPPASRQGHLF